MKDYQCEKTNMSLPDSKPQPHSIKEPDWLDLLERGEAQIIKYEDLPHFQNFDEFSAYLFSHKYTITVAAATGITLDHCLNFLKVVEKRKLAWVWGKRNEDTQEFERGGELDFGSVLLRVRPCGKGGRKGYRKISVHTPGNQKNGYLLDWTYLVSSTEQILPTLAVLKDLGLVVPKAATMAAMSRDLLQVYCPRAFQGCEKIGPDYLEIMQMSLAAFRLGRFEAVTYGTIPNAYVYDIKAAYPTKIRDLQHFAPPYTEWKKFDGDYSQLDRDDIAYALLYIEEFLPEGQISIASQRTYTMGGTRLSYPWGAGRRSIGLQQYKLRKAAGYHLKILKGWLGFTKVPFKPFEILMKRMSKGRQVNPGLFKALDVRIGGNFASSYMEIIDDGSPRGKLVRKPLETYCPVYAAAIVDAVLADMATFALMVPPGKLYRMSVDGISTGIELPSSVGVPGQLELKFKGTIRIFTDHISDSKGEPNWANKYNDGYLEVERDPISSFVNCFGKIGDPRRQQELFDTGFTKGMVKVPVGPTKRFAAEQQIDYMKDSAISTAPNSLELPGLFASSWFEEDYMDITDEGI